MSVDVFGPDFGRMSGIEVWHRELSTRWMVLETRKLTLKIVRERDANRIRCPQEILGKRRDGSSIANGNWSIVSMGVVIDRLLVILELDGYVFVSVCNIVEEIM